MLHWPSCFLPYVDRRVGSQTTSESDMRGFVSFETGVCTFDSNGVLDVVTKPQSPQTARGGERRAQRWQQLRGPIERISRVALFISWRPHRSLRNEVQHTLCAKS